MPGGSKCIFNSDWVLNSPYNISKGPFTWKEDDPSARVILEGSFDLHAKTGLLGSNFHLVYMQDFWETISLFSLF